MTGSHLPSILEICKILMDRGYNVTLIAPVNYTAQSLSYRSIPQIIFDPEELGFNSNASAEIKNILPDDELMSSFKSFHKITVSSYLPLYKIYKETAKEVNVDLFFCDHFFNNPCYDLAWKLGKPA
ncbi:19028_t:CDS:2, partial [Racocetra persica]